MKSKNTMTGWQYIKNHLIWLIGFLVWYKLLFKNIEEFSYDKSKAVLITMLIVCLVVEILLTYNNYRNRVSVLINLIFPFGIYTIYVYSDIWKNLISTIAIVCTFFSILYALLVLFRKIKNIEYWEETIILRLKVIMAAMHKIYGIGLTCIMFVLLMNLLINSSFLRSNIPKIKGNEAQNKDYVEENIETLLQFQDGKWEQLSAEEKIDSIQIMVNMECAYLGLPHELNAEVIDLTGEYACYEENRYKIYISTRHLREDSGWSILNSIAHESYHSYEHLLVELYESSDEKYKSILAFDFVEDYRYEIDNYIDPDVNFEEYYNQEFEAQARTYAEERLKYYQQCVDEYLEEW